MGCLLTPIAYPESKNNINIQLKKGGKQVALKSILTGWLRRFKLIEITDAQKALSDMRLLECKRCIYADSKKILYVLNGSADYVNSLSCSKCHCPCLEKSLVTSEHCPINKW